MRMSDIIAKKRDNIELTNEEIEFFVTGFTEDNIPDYQAASLLMAIYFNGMTEVELATLTMAMVNSGDTIDLTGVDGIKVDKHSTGGVGDTTTLVLAPLVAALGIPVAKMSGRGLGHTGGTLDKLEAIDGFNIEIDEETFITLVNEHKIAVIGQSGNLTPADKKLYALRDVTSTVNSIPLIASSIMSKKIAAGADAIVLDVKYGDGAFMKTVEDAEQLARAMVNIGQNVGRKTMAIISSMQEPLGFAIGNALEVKEAIDILKGKGPDDLREISLLLAAQMTVLAGKADSIEEATQLLVNVIDNGAALEKFRVFIENQGGNSDIVDNPELLPQAKYIFEVYSKQSGYVTSIGAQGLGVASSMLGAGRAVKDDVIDLAVGIVIHKKVGDAVTTGESLAAIYANHEDVVNVKQKVLDNYTIGEQIHTVRLIEKVITE